MRDSLTSSVASLLSGIYRASLSVPHTQSMLIQPLPLLLVRPDEGPDLVVAAGIHLW